MFYNLCEGILKNWRFSCTFSLKVYDEVKFHFSEISSKDVLHGFTKRSVRNSLSVFGRKISRWYKFNSKLIYSNMKINSPHHHLLLRWSLGWRCLRGSRCECLSATWFDWYFLLSISTRLSQYHSTVDCWVCLLKQLMFSEFQCQSFTWKHLPFDSPLRSKLQLEILSVQSVHALSAEFGLQLGKVASSFPPRC